MIKLNKPSCPNPSALRRNYKHPENKEALRQASAGKCIYCESKVDNVYFGDVEHIKPKSLDPENLTYEWSNLGFICAKCNNAKSNKYDEDCVIVNPYTDDPSQYIIAAHATIFCIKGSERGEKTIIDVDLNRDDLIESRRLKIRDVDNAIKNCYRVKNSSLRKAAMNELIKQADFDQEYSACVRSFLVSQGIISR